MTAAIAAACAMHPPAVRAGDPASADCSGPGPDELTCLACNIYYEARNQSDAGQLAVAMVTLNRLRAPDYPKSICAVVWESRRVARTGASVAQFSWTQEPRTAPFETVAWRKAVELARLAVGTLDQPGSAPDPSLGALFFHASYVSPKWSNDGSLDLVTRIGDHLFYRDRSVPLDDRPILLPAVLPTVLPTVRQNAATPPGSPGATPPPDGFAWMPPRAKLIRIAAGPAPNTLSVSSIEQGHTRTTLVGREGSGQWPVRLVASR